MSNLSSTDELTWAQDEIDDLWYTINSFPSNSFNYWISLSSFIFAILGSLSNLMSVIVLLKLSTQLSTFVYLTSLSISDMITCLTIIIIQISEYIVQTRQSTFVTIFLRQIEIIFGALAAGSRVLSFWISTAVTMDRWLLICYPLYGKKICTLNRAKNVSRILFIIAVIYSIPLFFEYEIIQMPSVYQIIQLNNQSTSLTDDKINKNSMLVTKGYSDLAKRRIYRWSYMFFNAIFVYTLPTLTIFFFNIQLIRALHRLKSRKRRLSPSSYSERSLHGSRRYHHSKYSITVMVIAMVLALLLCRSPTIVLWILWSFDLTIKTFFDSTSSSLVRRFHNIANLIAIINAATNFIPFCVFGQLFRAECLTIYCCRKRTSEQLAQIAKRKYQEKHQNSKKFSKIKTNINQQETIHIQKDNLHLKSSSFSNTPSEITPSSTEQNQSTNVLQLSNPPLNSNGNIQQQQQFNILLTTITPSKKTIHL